MLWTHVVCVWGPVGHSVVLSGGSGVPDGHFRGLYVTLRPYGVGPGSLGSLWFTLGPIRVSLGSWWTLWGLGSECGFPVDCCGAQRGEFWVLYSTMGRVLGWNVVILGPS